jgi:hypothetical protein
VLEIIRQREEEASIITSIAATIPIASTITTYEAFIGCTIIQESNRNRYTLAVTSAMEGRNISTMNALLIAQGPVLFRCTNPVVDLSHLGLRDERTTLEVIITLRRACA